MLDIVRAFATNLYLLTAQKFGNFFPWIRLTEVVGLIALPCSQACVKQLTFASCVSAHCSTTEIGNVLFLFMVLSTR